MSAPAKHHFITSNFLICSLLNCAKAHVGGEPHGCIATGLVRSSSSSVRSVRSAGHAFRLHKMGGGCCLSTVYNFWLSEVQDELSINRFRTKSFGSRQNSKNMQEQPFVSHPRRKNILHHLEPQYKPSPRGCRTYWLNGSVNCVHLCIVSIPLPVTVFFWLGCRFFSKVIPTYTDCCR